MLGKTLTLVTLASAITLLFIMQVTNPNSAGPAGILAVFFLSYVVIFGLLTRLIHIAGWLAAKLMAPARLRRPVRPLSLPHAAYIASIVAMAPVMLMAISSVGKLGVYEVFLVIAFVGLGIFYVEKRIA